MVIPYYEFVVCPLFSFGKAFNVSIDQGALKWFLEESVLGIRSRHSEQIVLKADHNTSAGVSHE